MEQLEGKEMSTITENNNILDAIPDADSKMTPTAWKVLIFVFLAWVIDAADSTIYSLTIPAISTEFHLSLSEMGMIASMFLAGTVLGSFAIPVLAEKKGRRIGMVTCIGLYSAFTGIVGIAQNAMTVVAGRFFTGCGTGAEWPIGAAYLSEMVPAKRRGWAMGIMQAGYPVGYFLAAGLFGIISALGAGWRVCYFVLVIPALMCIPVLTQLKESNTWLKNKQKLASQEQATKSDKKSNYAELFKPQYRKYTIISTVIHIFGAIYSYGLVIWVPSAIMLDFHISKGDTAQFVMFAWGVGTFGYLAAGRLADHFGRKKILTLYTILGAAAVLILNYLHTLSGITLVHLLIPGAFIGISLGVAAIYITYSSEVYPSHVRTLGMGFSVAVGKITAVFVPTVMGAIAQQTSVTLSLLASTVIGLLMIPTIFCGPETARRKLEEIID
jgi:MFS family permease